jgi:hypothetical protein
MIIHSFVKKEVLVFFRRLVMLTSRPPPGQRYKRHVSKLVPRVFKQYPDYAQYLTKLKRQRTTQGGFKRKVGGFSLAGTSLEDKKRLYAEGWEFTGKMVGEKGPQHWAMTGKDYLRWREMKDATLHERAVDQMHKMWYDGAYHYYTSDGKKVEKVSNIGIRNRFYARYKYVSVKKWFNVDLPFK